MTDPRFLRGAGCVSSLGPRLICCPKYRHRLLGGRVGPLMNEVLGEVAEDKDSEIVAREVRRDRAHIFARVAPAEASAEVVRAFKALSARVLRQGFSWLRQSPVLWSKSYFAASVGHVAKHTLRLYVEHQWDEAA